MNLKAFAKANLILKVIGEENKYHLLQMLNVRINVFDEIAINVNKKKTDVLKYENTNLDPNKDDLIIRALNLFRKSFGIDEYYDIVVKKEIPIGAGLGGGSCDVGTILRYVASLHNVDIYNERFINEVKLLGADIPYALYLKPCKVSGIGEIIEPVDIKYEKEFICIYPNVMTSTKMIFEYCNNIAKPLNLDIVIKNINKGNLEVLENDLQDITMSLYKEISHLIKDLSINNIVLMSGSGSSILVFAKDVDYEYEKCKEKYPNYWIKKVKIIEE